MTNAVVSTAGLEVFAGGDKVSVNTAGLEVFSAGDKVSVSTAGVEVWTGYSVNALVYQTPVEVWTDYQELVSSSRVYLFINI